LPPTGGVSVEDVRILAHSGGLAAVQHLRGDRDGAPTKAFEPSLFAWATVMSRPTEDRTIVGLNAQIDQKLLNLGN
jgi:hypothetical protein